MDRAKPNFLKSLELAAKKESLGKTILQLAWTAGPVTFLALQGGYILGFGQSAPPNLFIYFAFYTIIAGIVSIFVRFFFRATRGLRTDTLKQQVDLMLQRFPDLIHHVHNVNISFYDTEERKFFAASYILENPDAETLAIQTAVEDATGNKKLAYAARRVENYRKNGMGTRIEDEYTSIRDTMEKVLSPFRDSYPGIVGAIERRMGGHAPTKKEGRPRNSGFIERTLAAGEEYNYSILSVNDVEDMLTLAFELIAGKEFPILSVQYKGARVFTDTSIQLENHRRAYRNELHAKSSRLRLLAEVLSRTKFSPNLSYRKIREVDTVTLFDAVQKAIEKFYSYMSKKRDLTLLHEYRRVLFLYKELVKIQKSIDGRIGHLKRAEKKYTAIRNELGGSFPLSIRENTGIGRGIRIIEGKVRFPDKNKAYFIGEIFTLVSNIWRESPKPGTTGGSISRESRLARLKHLAVEIGRALEKEVGLHRFPVQQAIETVPSANLMALESGLSAKTKIERAVELVGEVEINARKQLLALVRGLISYHQVSLPESSIDYLAERFNIAKADLLACTPAEDRQPGKPQKPEKFRIHPLPKRYALLLEKLYQEQKQ